MLDPEAIIDLRISSTPAQADQLHSYGYSRVPELAGTIEGVNYSFAKGQCLWAWRRKMGSCGGRLKPIVDIYLTPEMRSTQLVALGYLCLQGSINGLCFWVRRAEETMEDEQRGITDLKFTTGVSTAADGSAPQPGMEWSRADGNFASPSALARAFSSSFTITNLWSRSAASEKMSSLPTESNHSLKLTGKETSIKVLKREAFRWNTKSYALILLAVRRAIRNYVPLEDMHKLSTQLMLKFPDAAAGGSDRPFDFSFLFHKYTKNPHLSLRELKLLLKDVGVRLAPGDKKFIFYLFNVCALDLKLTNGDLCSMLSLTDYEVDCTCEALRSMVLNGTLFFDDSSRNLRRGFLYDKHSREVSLRQQSLLDRLFHHLNKKGDGFLEVAEMRALLSSLNIYLTEDEAQKVLSTMVSETARVVDSYSFTAFFTRTRFVHINSALRVVDAASWLRVYFARAGAADALWAALQARHKAASLAAVDVGSSKEAAFSPPDIMLCLNANGIFLHPREVYGICLLLCSHKNVVDIRRADIEAFTRKKVRSVGELMSQLEQKLLPELLAAHKAVARSSAVSGVADAERSERAAALAEAVTRSVLAKGATLRRIFTADAGGGGFAEVAVASVAQIKAGVEAYSRVGAADSGSLDAEEWLSLALLCEGAVYTGSYGSAAGATASADVEAYAIIFGSFLQGLCEYAAQAEARTGPRDGSLEAACRQLAQLLLAEAKKGSPTGAKGCSMHAAFRLFDLDNNKQIDSREFALMLKKFGIVTNDKSSFAKALLKLFDRTGKGFVIESDFDAFIAESRDLIDDSESDSDTGADDSPDSRGKSSNTAPFATTPSADLNWLLWALWREALRVQPRDPCAAVHHLRDLCCQCVDKVSVRFNHGDCLGRANGSISQESLWEILKRSGLRGGVQRHQFVQGVRYLKHDFVHFFSQVEERNPSKVPVDYEALCRYTLSLGGMHEADAARKEKIDEQQFLELWSGLRRELTSLRFGTENDAGASNGVDEPSFDELPRFARAFYRVDANKDGRITRQEFCAALKRLRVSTPGAWSAAMVSRLFADSAGEEGGGDSLLDLKAFVRAVLRKAPADAARLDAFDNPRNIVFRDYDGADYTGSDETDIDTFDSRDVFTKVKNILANTVPVPGPLSPGGAFETHVEAIVYAVRSHFSTRGIATGDRGIVTEDRFYAFARRSGLLDGLTSVEFKHLLRRLRRPSVAGMHLPPDGRAAQPYIDYDRLCRRLLGMGAVGYAQGEPGREESAPHSAADAALARLQEAAVASSMSGRDFLALCRLVDHEEVGVLSYRELIHACKMAGCALSVADIVALAELLPAEACDKRLRKLRYADLDALVHSRLPTPLSRTDQLTAQNTSANRAGALPRYTAGGSSTAPLSVTHLGRSLDGFSRKVVDFNPALATPGGLLVSSASSMKVGADGGSGGAFRKVMNSLFGRVLLAVAERSRLAGARFALFKQLEAYDLKETGFVPLVVFQTAMDELGVQVAASDLHALSAIYGRPVDDSVDYFSFCRSMTGYALATAPSRMSSISLDDNRLIAGYKQLSVEGRDARAAFRERDIDGSGVVSHSDFRQVMVDLQLVRSEHQLAKISEEFCSVSDRGCVSYEDLLGALAAQARLHDGLVLGGAVADEVDAGKLAAIKQREVAFVRQQTQELQAASKARRQMVRGRDGET